MPHPDEGTIHAWLDGALPPGEARSLEEHVAGCAACGAAVAEARGLLAASSRILSALDSVPGGVLPAANPETSGMTDFKANRVVAPRWRSTPWRAAAAIVLVGSVSWLATQSGVRDRDAAAVVYDTAALPTSRGAEASMPKSSVAKGTPRAAPVAPVAPSAATAAAAARAPERQPETFAAAPMPNAGMVAGATAGMATSEATPPPNVNVTADEARQEVKTNAATAARSKAVATGPTALERRTDAASSVVMQTTPSMAATGASMARLMPGGDAMQRLAGCYTLELLASAPQSERDESIARQLPHRIELLAERAALPAGMGEMLLKPAAGEPPFAAGTQGMWQATARDAVRISIGEGTTWVSATLTLAGDSVSGIATAGERKAIVKGAKSACVNR